MFSNIEAATIAGVMTVIFIGGMLAGFAARHNEHTFYKEHQKLIQECQSKLPRDKFCKLITVEDK